MNRRDLLLAASAALACTATGPVRAMNGRGGAVSSSVDAFGTDCSLLPVRPASGQASGREIALLRFFPDQTDRPNRIESLALDLLLQDDRWQTHTIYAWQLSRRGCMSCSGNFRMTLPAPLTTLVVHHRQRGMAATRSWSGQPILGFQSLLVTARSSTGRVPLGIDLRLDPVTLEPSLIDGSPRDFDTLLLSAS